MRGVVEDPDAQIAADVAFETWERAEEAWDMIKWVLSRDPTKGEPLTEGGQARSFTFHGAVAYDMPTIVVIYIFNDDLVTIKAARFEQSTHPHTGTS
jgi:hypothetical protein